MNWPPAFFELRVSEADKRPVHLWLPLFLLWPFVLVLVVLAMVLTILVDVALYVFGQEYHSYTQLVLGCLGLLTETRGLTVYVRNERTNFELTVR